MRRSTAIGTLLFSLLAAGTAIPPVQAQDFDEGQDPVWDIDDDLETEDEYLNEEDVLLTDDPTVIVPAEDDEAEIPGGYGSTGALGDDRYEVVEPDTNLETNPDTNTTTEPTP